MFDVYDVGVFVDAVFTKDVVVGADVLIVADGGLFGKFYGVVCNGDMECTSRFCLGLMGGT